jgi:hypothetical protein
MWTSRNPAPGQEVVHRLQGLVTEQAQGEGSGAGGKAVAYSDLAQLLLRLERVHVTAPRDVAAFQQLPVAREHDPPLFRGQPADCLVAEAIVVQRVEAQHAKKSRKPAQVRIRHEGGRERDFDRERIYLDHISFPDGALQGGDLAVDFQRADLGVRHAERLDGVLQVRGARAAIRKEPVSVGSGEKLGQLAVEPEVCRAQGRM